MHGMASAAAFDTFQAARALESAGVDRTQAEAIAEAIQRRQDHATKSDVMGLGGELRKETGELAAELRKEIAELGAELRREIAELGAELRGRIDELGAEVRGRLDKLEAEMSELRSDNARLRAELAALETRLMNRIYVIAIGQAGLIAAFGLFT